jgi:hypothetical protein
MPATLTIQATIPRPEWEGRAKHGSWQEPAAVVMRMVKGGWGISEAVRKVCADIGVPAHYHARAFAGIRGAYYQFRKMTKPNQKRP